METGKLAYFRNPERLKQENHKFKSSLSNSVRPCLRITVFKEDDDGKNPENVVQCNGPKFNL